MRKIGTVLALVLVPLCARATVTSTASTVSFTCTNSTGPFPFTFPALDVGALQVIDIAAGALPGVMTVLTYSTQWTASPVNNSYANGGLVTLVSPCPTGDTLTIARVTEETQLTHYTPNMPALYANFENNVDQLTTGSQDGTRAAQVHIGTVTGSGSAVVSQTPLGQYLNLYFPQAGSTSSSYQTIGSSVYLADGSTPASVLAFGAKCDGSTDDTAAIQAGITWEAAHHGTLTLPSGQCNISSSLVIPFTQFLKLKGQCKQCSIIEMTANNVPIIVANQPDTHTIFIEDLKLEFRTQQTTSNTQAYGIQWTGSANDPDGFYRWSIARIEINHAYIGMGVYSTAGNKETLWNSSFYDVTVTNTAQTVFSLAPAVGIGMPQNLLVNLAVYNTGGGGLTPAGPAIVASAAPLTLINPHFEGWKNEITFSTGGGQINILGGHIEHHSISASGRVFYMANAQLSVEGLDISFDGTPAVSGARIFDIGAGGSVKAHDDTLYITPVGAIYWTTTTTAGAIDFLHLIDALSGLTSMVGTVPVTAIADWGDGPGYYANFKQNQNAPQMVQEGVGSSPNSAGFYLDLPNTGTGAGRVFYTWSGVANLWHVAWLWMNNDQIWHFQKCADATGTSSGPPSTVPAGCSDSMTIDGAGNVNAGVGFEVGGAATAAHYLRGNGTHFVDAAIGSGDLPTVIPQSTATQTAGQVVCIKTTGPPATYGTCTALTAASGVCSVCN